MRFCECFFNVHLPPYVDVFSPLLMEMMQTGDRRYDTIVNRRGKVRGMSVTRGKRKIEFPSYNNN